MNKINHIAFIMDGNGRWGVKEKRNRNQGHLQGVETVKKIVKKSIILKIPIITFLCFFVRKLEKTKKKEIYFLFKLIKNYFVKEIKSVSSQGIKINILGEIKKLPSDLSKILLKSMHLTKKNNKILVNLAINYGSQQEIFIAAKKKK